MRVVERSNLMSSLPLPHITSVEMLLKALLSKRAVSDDKVIEEVHHEQQVTTSTTVDVSIKNAIDPFNLVAS